MATLITGDWVVGFDGQNHVLIPDGVVIVDGDRVVYVGPTYDGTTERTIGGAGMLVSPGFIDVHVHAGTRTLHRLFSDSGRVELFGQPFLEVRIARPGSVVGESDTVDRETGMTPPERLKVEADFTAVELITSGVTTFLEFGTKLPMQEALVKSVTQLGNRAYLAVGFESGHWSCNDTGSPVFQWNEGAGQKEFEAGLTFLDDVSGCADDRIRGALAPRHTEGCTPALLQACLKKASDSGLPVAIHAAYNVHEFYQIVVREGKTPIEFLEGLGFLDLGPLLNIGHCNFTGELAPLQYSGGDDVRLVGDHSCTISHCPINLVRRARYLDSWKRYQAAGVNMAIGSDTYPRDMIMQMRAASYLGKVMAGDLHSATAAEMFDAATTGPARSLGRDDLGRLSPGAKADLIVIDLKGGDGLRIGPVRDPIHALVECGIADDVRTVMIDGEIRMENRVVSNIDIAALRANAQKLSDGLWSALPDWDPLNRTADEMNPPSYPVVRS